jgi:hypothetical protein
MIMNNKFDNSNFNHYEGNGWSKYQMLVLQQLDDHNKLLQNMNKDINELRQATAVSDTELKMWRAQTMATIQRLDEDVEHILYDEKGLAAKLSTVERELDIEEQTRTKWKATIALYGAILMFLINIAVQIVTSYFRQ